MNQTPNEITDCALLGCLCKCHVEDEEDPGPHLSTCFWSDPEFPRAHGLVVLEGGQTAPHVVGSWEGATGPEDDRTMLHGHTPPDGALAALEDVQPPPLQQGRCVLPAPTIGRLVGAERGAVLPDAERCNWIKIAGKDQQVRCVRPHHNTLEESDRHDWSGPLEPRTPITVSTKYVGAWDPREQPGARVELTHEQIRDFTGATAEANARLASPAYEHAARQKYGDGAPPPIALDVAGKPYAFPPFAAAIADADAELAKHTLPANWTIPRMVGEPRSEQAYEQAAAPLVDARHRPWFLTVTGRQFFYDDPESYPYSIGEIAHALSNLCRFAGHLATFYSVAEHSVLVARALGIDAWQTLEYPGDINPLLRAALIHDASEAFLMDLPRPLKRLPGLEGYRILEDRVQLAIERRFGLEGHHDAVCVKRADAAVLVAEKRQLRPPHLFGERGDITDGQTPADVTCRSLPPRLAREFFLDAWHGLGGK